MSVRNPTKTGPRKAVVNQKAISPRGTRRSSKDQSYLDNLNTRKHQSSPTRTRTNGAPGPLKGPTKRPTGVVQESWRNYMSGKSSELHAGAKKKK